jgi:hypothetical protein
VGLGRVGLPGRLAIAAARLVAALLPRPQRDPQVQVRLERAAAGIDREFAANLELVTMFMQTKQPATLENAAFLAGRAEIAAADEELAARLDVLYDGMSDAESAMERRGPAGSIRAEDRATVQHWEGSARVLQRAVRTLAASRPRSAGDRLVAWVTARVRGRPAGG